MNNVFSSEFEDEDAEPVDQTLPVKNYITSAGHQCLKKELLHLIDIDRPEVVQIVSWAASNGDRSENGDYIYGKKRLREIDRRIRFLTKRLDLAEIVDSSVHYGSNQIFFGAKVTYRNHAEQIYTVTIVGVDEIDPLNGKISWISPVAKALNMAREGDSVMLITPAGKEQLEVLEVKYQSHSFSEKDPH